MAAREIYSSSPPPPRSFTRAIFRAVLVERPGWGGGVGGSGDSHTLPIRVCAAQRGRDFEAPDLERGIHFRGVF